MYVGVILNDFGKVKAKLGIPHVCGGDPIKAVDYLLNKQYSPCMWG